MKPLMQSYNERIKKGLPNKCWNWTGEKHKAGYGVIKRIGKSKHRIWAHHFSWIIYNKQPIPEGMNVLHKCDNPSCCNPRHLYLGTPANNAYDRDSRGRFTPLKGEKNGNAKLTKNDVNKIRKLIQQKIPYYKIAKQFKVSPSLICSINKHRVWN